MFKRKKIKRFFSPLIMIVFINNKIQWLIPIIHFYIFIK